MSVTPAQRYSRAAQEMESSALDLLRLAERFHGQIPSTTDRVNRSEEMLRAARREAFGWRNGAKVRRR